MNYESIIPFLAVIIVVLFLFFSVFLLTVKTEKKLSNTLLASFLIVVALDISAFFYTKLIQLPLAIEMLRIQISNFKDPLLFLYILSVIYSNFKLKKIHFVHLLPWVISILVLAPNFFLVDENLKRQFLENFDSTTEVMSLRFFGRLISLAYFVAPIYYVIRYRKLLLENYTDKNAFKNYNWLKQLLILISIGQILTIIKNISRQSYTIETTNMLRIITLTFGVFLIFWLVFKALNSPKLFRGIDVNLIASKDIVLDNNLNTKTHQQIALLKKFMSEEKPFLNPSLTIRGLALDLKISMRELSVLINQNLNQHFFDFVNEYRIEAAKSILKNPAKKEFTVLEILYEVGFNSKSSFNTAFKKHTGLTPTQFRKTA
ncbi:MAG: helix-turn-helix domain-containing protein [Polaribacter sp.]